AEVETFEVAPGRCNVLARSAGAEGAPTILLDAHQDTVPVDGMTVPAFEAVVRDGRITGRGACDVKGPMAAMLFAFRRLMTERPAGAANVLMSCTCDEEATTLGIRHLVETWQSGRSRLLPVAPDVAIVAEPTSLDVVVAHRGVLRFKIRTAGVACHSSNPAAGVNAIYRMARVVSVLQEYAAQLASGEQHPLCGPATLSVGRIDGGVSVNIVPESCSVEIDRRLRPGETFATALEELRQSVTTRVDFPATFEPPWIECPPFGDGENRELSSDLLSHIGAVAGPRKAIGVPFGTHAAYTSAAGVPSVVFGPGSIEQAHTKDEFIEIEPLRQAAEIYYRICAGSLGTPALNSRCDG
ncbi:MAG TPA: M20 family metallopeptidase, partial [Caulifigura sp.]|nr:M20 family metallopeptidase [Caulifigura sp.]